MRVHTYNLSTWRLRQEDCCELKANLNCRDLYLIKAKEEEGEGEKGGR